jgi:hypothetical protein
VRVSSAVGVTDASGRYSLNYKQGVRGAPLGTHWVEIRAPDETGQERLSRRYFESGSSGFELTAEVEPGRNEIDFPLMSDP